MIELVGKIGSMALIDPIKKTIDEGRIANIAKHLKPKVIWVTSGAVEVGRLDYMARHSKLPDGEKEELKTDFAAQGQSILMQTYRKYINPQFSVRQILVEHSHFNNAKKREHIKGLLLRAASQNAIPIVNYNDAVSSEETRRFEIQALKYETGEAVELVDNDETASTIAGLVKTKVLLILSTLDGIYKDLSDPKTLIREISSKSYSGLVKKIDEIKSGCFGASRLGANGAAAKLEYIKPALKSGTRVIIASSRYDIGDILKGTAPSTMIYKNS